MTSNVERTAQTSLSPGEAFSVLGNEKRLRILQALGDAEAPVHFTELRERVDIEQGTQFNYHLDRLVGHFVAKTGEGYQLARPGERVIEAVAAGGVADNPLTEPTVLDEECYHCGAPIVTTYRRGLAVFCTNCAGNYVAPPRLSRDVAERAGLDGDIDELGLLRGFPLPPAGLQDRSGLDRLRVANAWANWETFAGRMRICPRCSATIDASVRVCDSHNHNHNRDREGGACDECGSRYAVDHVHNCTNCTYHSYTQFGRLLLAETPVLHFLTSHGINPIAPESPMSMRAIMDGYDERVVSTDPFRGRFTFTIADDSLTLTVDEDLSVVDVTRHGTDDPDR